MLKFTRAALAAACLWAVSAVGAQAQSACPYIIDGNRLTAAQWNFCFGAKQDTLNFPPLNKNGDVMVGKLTTAPSINAGAGFNLSPGQAPTTPKDGDIWMTTSGLFYRYNSGTYGPVTGSVSSVGISAPADFTITGSPVTVAGTLALAWATAPTGTGAVVRAAGPSISNPIVIGSFTATGLVTNADLVNQSTTVNGQTCTLGGSCTISASAANITIGTTGVVSGTPTRVLFDNAGTLGEYTISGSGSVAMTTSPAFTTPLLGVATATSINKVTITQPATGSTLTIADGKTLTDTSGIGASILLGAAGGGYSAYAGTACTNQLVRSLSAAGVAGCASIANADLVNSSMTFGSTSVSLGSTLSAATARGSSGFNIESLHQTGDANVTIAATTRTEQSTTTLTAPRTWTLPAANALNPGQSLIVSDAAGAVNGVNTITVARAGSDTINGGASVSLTTARLQLTFISDGVSTWTYNASSIGSGTVTNAVIAAGTGIGVSGTCNITTSGTCTVSLSSARQTLPTRQVLLSGTSATYTTPANALWIEVQLVGGGGGGVGTGSAGAGNGGNGGATSFGTVTAPGGTGSTGSTGGAGGVAGVNGDFSIPGGIGGNADVSIALGPAGMGGNGHFGGAGVNGPVGAAGGAGSTNSGAGGGGGGSASGVGAGGGGGSGAYTSKIIGTPAGTYTYSVGTSGAGGTAGTSGFVGGAGAVGIIIVTEHYGS